MRTYSPTILVKSGDFRTSWALVVHCVMQYGAEIPEGPPAGTRTPMMTKDCCLTIEHLEDSIEQMLEGTLHELYPQKRGTDLYTKQYIKGTDEYIQANREFDYTYPGRICDREICTAYHGGSCESKSCQYYNAGAFTEDICYIDQMQRIAANLKPFDRRLQAVTWDVSSDLVVQASVPCLQIIHIRGLGDDHYEVHLHWRSRDIFKAWQLNLIGIMRFIDRYMREYWRTDAVCVKMTEHIDMAHIYESEWDAALKVPVQAKWLNENVFK